MEALSRHTEFVGQIEKAGRALTIKELVLPELSLREKQERLEHCRKLGLIEYWRPVDRWAITPKGKKMTRNPATPSPKNDQWALIKLLTSEPSKEWTVNKGCRGGASMGEGQCAPGIDHAARRRPCR